MHTAIKIVGEHDAKTVNQLKRCVDEGAERGILCADGHYGYAQPVGGVVAYKNCISISGVGFDIACGNLAYKTDVKVQHIQSHLSSLADAIQERIAFGIGRKNHKRIEHELFDSDPAWDIPFIKSIQNLATEQLGTVGSGNHYVDIFKDRQDCIWVGVHFGSRGLGHKIATHYLTAAGGKEGMDVSPAVVDITSDIGEQYLKSMALAGRYAYAGREYVGQYVVKNILGAHILDTVHNHHNFAWEETHAGERYWVVRKGATPAFPGQRGFVGGSMGDISVILEGIEHAESKNLLYSTVHGAGRVMSRTAAAGKVKWIKGRPTRISKGAVDETVMRQLIAAKGIELRGGGADEAPQVYLHCSLF
jgi:tRNA-splicing ligase RtcB